MRTTITIEPDLAEKLQDFAHRHKMSFKKALNELLRRGLQAPGRSEKRAFSVEPHHGGFRPGIDVGRLNQLADQLEVMDFRQEATQES